MKRFTLMFLGVPILLCGSWSRSSHGVVANALAVAAAQESRSPGQSASQPTPAAIQSTPPFQLRVESNLVVVRTVVRDSQGNAVRDLKKDDFKIFDNGVERPISQFSVEIPPARADIPSTPVISGEQKSPTHAAPPAPRSTAFYFDDLNMALDEINGSRDAAQSYLAGNLQSPDRAAVFTSSGNIHTDFTSDLKTLRDALARVVPLPNIKECPDISDYQAERIVDHDEDIGLAVEDLKNRCHACPPNGSSGDAKPGGEPPTCPPYDVLVEYVRHDAEVVLSQGRARSARSIGMLNAIVLGMAHMSGQKEIILTSSGFLTTNIQDDLNHMIDHALSSQIVISSLDPKGVALLMPGLDVSSSMNPQLIPQMNTLAESREFYASAVLAQVAEETGGDFYRHNNDLKAGFARLDEEPVSYMLAFSPGTLDGKFHKLQVKLTQSKGILQARRGYFAVKPEHDQPAESQDELHQVVASAQEFHDLTMSVTTQLGAAMGESRELSVMVKLDLNSVRFRKDGDRNINTLIFVSGIYDHDGKWITGEQKRFDFQLPDEQLQDMRAKGVGVKNTFQLKPGAYVLRTVVQDSEDHHLGALSRDVQVQ